MGEHVSFEREVPQPKKLQKLSKLPSLQFVTLQPLEMVFESHGNSKERQCWERVKPLLEKIQEERGLGLETNSI